MKYLKQSAVFKICLLIFGLLLAKPEVANASHFRYGNITWERVTGQPNQIRFRVTQAWRRSFFGSPGVGSTVSTGSLVTGVGSTTINLTVTSVNITEDWFYGEFTYVQTYPTTTATYNAYFQGCCRISSLINNSNDAYLVSTLVTIGNNNDAPVSTVPPFISLPVNTTAATYQLPATDPNGDSLTFSLVNNGGFGSGTVQPSTLSVSSSGLLTFNTTSASVGQLYNTAVYVTDSKGARIQLDLILRIAAPSTPPVFDYTVTPANNANYVIQPGQTLSFNVKASDNDSGDNVALSAVGVPVGATFNPANGNPVTQSFSWTPTLSSVGTYQVNFVAQDNASIQTNTIVNIAVSLKPNFVSPSPLNGSILCHVPGDSISNTFVAIDVDSTDSVSLSLATPLQSGMSFSPSLPTSAANPVSTNFSWSTTAANWGINTVVIRATDTYSETKDDSVFYIINTPPVFTTTQSNVTITAGQLFSYTFQTADADSAQGDSVSVESITLPSWMSIAYNGNGSWTVSGTPSLSDSGMHGVIIEIQDETNHFRGTHCGNNLQSFEVEVIPCNITTSTSVTDVLCNGDNTGAIDLTVNNATSPVSYSWSNSATTQDLSNVGAGTYTVSIVDANGCTAADTATIAEPATAVSGTISVSPSPTIGGHMANTIYLGYGPQSVTLSATASGGVPGYSYSWSTGATTASTLVSPATTTNYTVTITDANGCVFTTSVLINVIDARCGKNNNKVIVCHVPPGNNSNPQEICISSNAVATHLAHGCYVGPCGAAKGGRNTTNNNDHYTLMELEVEGGVQLYPNPNNGSFTIKLPREESATVIVTNLNGQVVYKNQIDHSRSVSVVLNNAVKGIYLIQVVYSDDSYRAKFSIE